MLIIHILDINTNKITLTEVPQYLSEDLIILTQATNISFNQGKPKLIKLLDNTTKEIIYINTLGVVIPFYTYRWLVKLYQVTDHSLQSLDKLLNSKE